MTTKSLKIVISPTLLHSELDLLAQSIRIKGYSEVDVQNRCSNKFRSRINEVFSSRFVSVTYKGKSRRAA